ncbi:hypothetical protein D779_2622 [Imhoffiella purpurea]|uniref:Diguanylate cyclase n=2 Tax=Imhoffiella purpurea TaxID=1249627 RepID=W9VBY3_9GAMM|nr:hypothetical protein D779_2622 [Imhoffiella purpurea]
MSEHHPNPRERRIQTRYPVDLYAKVRGRNQLPAICRVKNICNGGVLLAPNTSEPELPFQPGEHVDLHFDLPDAQSMDPVQAVIEVVHRVDRGFGARFTRLLGDGRSRLARFIRERVAQQQRTIDPDSNPTRARAREVLEEVGEQRLGGMVDSLLETLVDELWQYNERASSDAERALISSEIGLLAKAVQDESVSRRLMRELLDSLRGMGTASADKGKSQSNSPGDSAEAGLQLVDQDEFEVWLAKSELANRLEEELHEPLDMLRTQIGGLFHGDALLMDPMALAGVIERVLSEIGVGAQLQRLALQVATSHLSRNLGSFYRELLHAWTAAGLPELSGTLDSAASGASNPQAAADAAASISESVPGSGDPGAGVEPTPSAGPQVETDASRSKAAAAGLVAGLLGNYQSPFSYSGRNRHNRFYTRGRRIADLLANLPSGFQMPDPDPNRPLRELVTQWLRASESKKPDAPADREPVMSPQVEERVDVTDRLLSHMLADPTTPNQLKSLIKPLSTRFLSMAVTSPKGLADTNQPLVKLINQLEHLAMYLLNDDGSNENLKREYEEVVKKLVESDGRDPKAIDELSGRLNALEKRTGSEYQGNISNWVGICESRERSRVAREEVRGELNAAFAGRRMHKVVNELLDLGWRNLLDMVSANLGSGSQRWRRYWELLWTVHVMTGGEGESSVRVLELGTLVDGLREALAYIGTDPILVNDVLGRIETAVRRSRASLDREDDYLRFSLIPPDPENEPERMPAKVSPSDWQASLAEVEGLPLGTLVWMRGKEGSKALRLIWRNEDGSRLAVTDTMGKKVKVLRRARLAETFLRGQARAQAPTDKRIVTRAADAALSEMQERLQYHETHDPLTGLSNQRRLVGSLTQLLLSHAGASDGHALGFLELDRYDTLTGTFGYSVGERMLTAVARLLEGVLSEAVCLAYMGGSRFGLLTPVMDREHAMEIGESIRAGLTVMPFDLQGKPFRISGSLGIAMLVGDNSSPEKLISAASVACLAAQREGGDRVILFREDNELISRQLDHMRGWAQAEDVIKAGRRKLRYQRIVPIDPDGELSPHCEILLSVYDDQGMPLPLQSFIAAAEAFNMMREVDRQVIDEALKWVSTHPGKVREIGGVAINLSGQSLSDPGLLKYIRGGLERFRVPVEMVSFEVTETAAIVNLDQAAIILEDIKSLGCSIALDDFGAGMSSYSYLKRLPVDYVKIDGSFVKDILVSPHDREIVKSFNEIAHFMGKRTIAEYVENQEILELLRDIGVDYAQGYAIEKPQFIEDLP